MTPGQGQRMQQTMQQPHQQQQQQMQTNHQQQQQQPMRPLRPPFMQGPPNQTFPTQPNPNQTNFMNSGPRFQNIRMGVQGANMQQANMRQPIMQNVSFVDLYFFPL